MRGLPRLDLEPVAAARPTRVEKSKLIVRARSIGQAPTSVSVPAVEPNNQLILVGFGHASTQLEDCPGYLIARSEACSTDQNLEAGSSSIRLENLRSPCFKSLNTDDASKRTGTWHIREFTDSNRYFHQEYGPEPVTA